MAVEVGPHLLPLATYHTEFSCVPALSLPFVEGAVMMSCGPLPGAMVVIGHKTNEIQAPAGDMESVKSW